MRKSVTVLSVKANCVNLLLSTLTSRLAIIPGKVYMVEYHRMKYMCPHCDKKSDKAVIVSAPNNTPVPVTNKGLADASLIADIAQRKYQLGVPLYRQEKYWEAQGMIILYFQKKVNGIILFVHKKKDTFFYV